MAIAAVQQKIWQRQLPILFRPVVVRPKDPYRSRASVLKAPSTPEHKRFSGSNQNKEQTRRNHNPGDWLSSNVVFGRARIPAIQSRPKVDPKSHKAHDARQEHE